MYTLFYYYLIKCMTDSKEESFDPLKRITKTDQIMLCMFDG